MTKEEIKEYNKAYREKNKESLSIKNKAYKKQYNAKNKDKAKEYYQANKDKIKADYEANKEIELAKAKEYRENNKDKIKESYYKDHEKTLLQKKKYRDANKDKTKEYQKANKDKRNENKKQRLLNDPVFKLKETIRIAIIKAFKRNGFVKNSNTETILGCSFESFKSHIEGLFENWMSWDNKGLYNGSPNYGWDIDHITPISLAKTQDEIIKLNHYTNLRPLCSHINRDVKKDKVIH